jgi:hypothetical protein
MGQNGSRNARWATNDFELSRLSGSTGITGMDATLVRGFWADFDDDCVSTCLGTVEVAAHDYITMPAGACRTPPCCRWT